MTRRSAIQLLLRWTAVLWIAVPFRMSGTEQDSTVLRTVLSAVTLDAGSARNLDTYLSPIRYAGGRYRIGYEFMRATKFSPERWIHQIHAGISYDKMRNPASNNTMHTLMGDIDWSMAHRWRNVAVPHLDIYAGGSFGFEGGVTYNPRNSNNVCSPHIFLSAGLTGMAVYHLKMKGLPITVRYQPTIPVVGCYYLPDYDQSFYEIYLGNYWNTVNFGWWGNRFDMENELTVDLHFSAVSLRFGYRNNITTLWKNNISVQKTAHAAIVGVVWETLRISPTRGLPAKARMVSALY